MSTMLDRAGWQKESRTADFRGKSTDTKPTIANGDKDIPNCSTYLEIDTGDLYFYDADTDNWIVV